MARRRIDVGEDTFDLTPMIDVTFLMLIYFMVTTDPKQEADLKIEIPVPTDTAKPSPEIPVEMAVKILPDGTVLFNNFPVDTVASRNMPQLTNRFRGNLEIAKRRGVKAILTVIAHPASQHQRTVDVLNSAAAAGLEFVTFALGEDT
ncbi:MAG: ExbD/TolR family protein [Opitutales bacterium]